MSLKLEMSLEHLLTMLVSRNSKLFTFDVFGAIVSTHSLSSQQDLPLFAYNESTIFLIAPCLQTAMSNESAHSLLSRLASLLHPLSSLHPLLSSFSMDEEVLYVISLAMKALKVPIGVNGYLLLFFFKII